MVLEIGRGEDLVELAGGEQRASVQLVLPLLASDDRFPGPSWPLHLAGDRPAEVDRARTANDVNTWRFLPP